MTYNVSGGTLNLTQLQLHDVMRYTMNYSHLQESFSSLAVQNIFSNYCFQLHGPEMTTTVGLIVVLADFIHAVCSNNRDNCDKDCDAIANSCNLNHIIVSDSVTTGWAKKPDHF